MKKKFADTPIAGLNELHFKMTDDGKATNILFLGAAMKLLHLSAPQHDTGHTLRQKKGAECFWCYK